MKKLLLLLATISVVSNAEAQSVRTGGVKQPDGLKVNTAALHKNFMDRFHTGASGAAKTTGGGRWYNYSVYCDLKTTWDRTNASGIEYIDSYAPAIWNDTFGINSYVNTGGTYTTYHLNFVSEAMVLQPQFPGFNRTDLYGTGTYIKVGNSDTYQWDSVVVPGFYVGGKKSTAGHTDTLRLGFVQGDGSTTTNGCIFTGGTLTGGHYGTISFVDVLYDSVKNSAGKPSTYTGTNVPQYMYILLDNTDTSITDSRSYAYPVCGGCYIHRDKTTGAFTISGGSPTPINVAAGNMIGTSISFKTGETAAAIHGLPGDSLIAISGRYYNIYQPIVNYFTQDDPASVSNTVCDWAPFDGSDKNVGLYKELPNYDANGWTNLYVPNWAWSSSGTSTGAFYWQYPDVGFHIVCSGCSNVPMDVKQTASVTEINAVPNPANNELNITFSLVRASEVKISLINMLGQTVASQQIANTVSGKATFNTSALPAGLYTYTLKANGETSTGRVVIAH